MIGVQLENEYSASGPGKGVDHIRTLKQMALDAGLRVPFFTVTGWDGAAVPLDSVLPVFGGYPDAPWAATPGPMPGNEVYQFRFNNRAAGNMGALGGHGQNAADVYRGTPFLTAEVGDGIEDTYFRRPVVSTDDVASIPTVMLGSGANLLGYYMFHGGRNPDAEGITLQESQRTAYPTDVPVRSYDFQAPLGESGQVRESLLRLKLLHYFLNDFGSALAPMVPRVPDHVPEGPKDTTVPRVAARTAGDQGFVFLNNHLRGMRMPARPDFQVSLKLPSGTMRIPEQPIELPADTYGIWPVNLPLGSVTLRYSTAQLFKRTVTKQGNFFWFFSVPGVVPEFSLPATTAVLKMSPGVRRISSSGTIRLVMPQDTEAMVQLSDGINLVVLPRSVAEDIWRVDDPAVLVRSTAMTYSDGPTWTLETEGSSEIAVDVFGMRGRLIPGVPVTLDEQGPRGLFQRFKASVPEVSLAAAVQQVRNGSARGPWQQGPKVSWRAGTIAMAPDDREFAKAAEWEISLPKLLWSGSLADAFLEVRYDGDVARLCSQGTLLDDDFWNGQPWQVGLREVMVPAALRAGTKLQLQILPLPQEHPMYIEAADQLTYRSGIADRLQGLRLVPVYRFVLREPKHPGE